MVGYDSNRDKKHVTIGIVTHKSKSPSSSLAAGQTGRPIEGQLYRCRGPTAVTPCEPTWLLWEG